MGFITKLQILEPTKLPNVYKMPVIQQYMFNI